jgi:hypothetical protein
VIEAGAMRERQVRRCEKAETFSEMRLQISETRVSVIKNNKPTRDNSTPRSTGTERLRQTIAPPRKNSGLSTRSNRATID